MKRATLLAFLSLVALGTIVLSLYGAQYVLAHYNKTSMTNGQQVEQTVPPFPLRMRWRCGTQLPRGRVFRGFDVELSEGFREKVLNIAKADEDVQRLLNEGYNVSDIRIIGVKLIVQEDGKITMEASKALVILTDGNGGKALVEVDLKAGAVTRICVMSIRVIKKGTST